MAGFDWPWSRRIRLVLQAEAAECGLACLTMVAARHGHKVNLPGLRQLHPISTKGATLDQLMAIGSDIGLAPRALRLELDELPQLRLPAILHWDLNHFVVLEEAKRGSVTIVDPAAGRRRLTLAEANGHFTGVALELSPSPGFKPVEARARIRLTDLWSGLGNYGGAASQILALSLLLQLTALLMPFFLQLTIDEVIGRGNGDLMTLLLVGFAIVYALNGVTAALRSWVVLTLGQSLAFQLAGNVVRHLMRLPLGYFERRHVGDLMSRIGSIQPIRNLLTQGVINAMVDAGLAVTTLIVMAMISPALTVLVVATTLAYLLYSLLLYPGLRRRTEEELVARARQETYLMETIRSMRAIKLHAFETQRENGWRNQYAEVISSSYRAQIYGIRLDFGEQLLFGGQFLLIVFLGAGAVLAQELTIGLLLAFIAYRTSFMASASALVEQLQNWRLIGVHLERLSDIVTEAPEPLIARPRDRLLPPPSIRFEALSFAYAPTEPAVLDNVDFEIPRRALVAITGPSGSGKTTLMRVMLGLLPPTSGRIFIDSVPLTPALNGAWRGRVGAVLQDDVLLTGTLADNIAFFDPRLDQERVEAAARLARVHGEIMRMPMGYQSLVGDMGAALSAGQRQRILLARALYRYPDVLFLDEGTANLDEENENAIADMIAALPVTRIVVAHRPALIERAQIVLRLENGRIEEVTRGAVPQPQRELAYVEKRMADRRARYG